MIQCNLEPIAQFDSAPLLISPIQRSDLYSPDRFSAPSAPILPPMGNCCGAPPKTPKPKKGKKPNPFSVEYSRGPTTASPLTVLTNPTVRDIGGRYELGQELGRGEFGVTYLCTDREGGENLACKSISKKKLRTAVDIEDVRREVDIMRHLPQHPNIVTLKDTYEDGEAVHLVMELCEGGELFDRIVARGHYTERAAAGITRTVVEVVQVQCGDLELEKKIEEKIDQFIIWVEKHPNRKCQVSLSFYEVKNKQPSWPCSNKVERLYWEQWHINLNVSTPKVHSKSRPGKAPSNLGEDTLEGSSLRHAALESSLREVIFQIIKFLNEKKYHIPAVQNSDVISFPYKITVPSSSDSLWHADVLKRMLQTGHHPTMLS